MFTFSEPHTCETPSYLRIIVRVSPAFGLTYINYEKVYQKERNSSSLFSKEEVFSVLNAMNKKISLTKEFSPIVALTSKAITLQMTRVKNVIDNGLQQFAVNYMENNNSTDSDKWMKTILALVRARNPGMPFSKDLKELLPSKVSAKELFAEKAIVKTFYQTMSGHYLNTEEHQQKETRAYTQLKIFTIANLIQQSNKEEKFIVSSRYAKQTRVCE